MDEKKDKSNPPSSNLFALECLATTAGQLHESEKQKNLETKDKPNNVKSDEKTNKVSVVQMAPMSESFSIPSSITPFTSFYPTFQNPSSVVKPFPDFTMPPPFSQAPFRNFLDIMPPIPGAPYMKTEGIPWKSTGMHCNNSTSDVSKKNEDLHLSKEPAKSAFDIVSKNPSSTSISHHSIPNVNVNSSAYETTVSNPLTSNIPQQPPMLFRIDQPNNNSLLETLVQESQKILKSQDNFNQSPQLTSLKTLSSGSDKFFTDYNDSSKKETEQASKTNDDFKRAREMVLISPQKKTMRKQRTGLHSVSDVKRAYGGPPFKPGYPPPQLNTPESAMCCLYEHTLLKMATRGFWSGDRGPLQDVFRLTRVENSDLQYNMKEITQHCYNVVKRKLEFADGEKDMMQKHMRNYVDEFDSYLERIYPVSSIAISLYLPTAADYAKATWHGIVPTGWSEYRRAVIIREVFEVLYHLTSSYDTLPEYDPKFFDKKKPDKTLRPVAIHNTLKKENVENKEPSSTDQNNNSNHDNSSCGDTDDEKNNDVTSLCSPYDVKYSRAFEALWTHSAPEEPALILADNNELKLREYLEQYPIEVYAPSDEALIVVDAKKYKAKNILGFFRRGVQLVDYSKETGSMVIDTISTLRNVSATSAVRKIPPGRISKLVHPDLHLENYTNAILQIGQEATDAEHTISTKTTRIRKKRVKHQTPSDGKDEKVKRKRTVKNSSKEDHHEHYTRGHATGAENKYALCVAPVNEKLESIESFCHSFKDDNNGRTSNELFKHPADMDMYRMDGMTANLNGSIVNMECNQQKPRSPVTQESENYSRFSTDDTRTELKKPCLVNQCTQTYDLLRPSKSEIPSIFSPDILSPMYLPQPPPATASGQHIFSLHLMIDSYRRAAKYLMDTANHLELVARHTNNLGGNEMVLNNNNNSDSNTGSGNTNEIPSPFTKREIRDEELQR